MQNAGNAIHLIDARDIYLPGVARGHEHGIKRSSSPSLTANIVGRRLCVCANTYKLFAVDGTEQCRIDPALCY